MNAVYLDTSALVKYSILELGSGYEVLLIQQDNKGNNKALPVLFQNHV